MRVFNDENGKMNLNLEQIQGEILIVSQFTLHAATAKGNRPSFINAARPETAIPLYEYFIKAVSVNVMNVKTGIFGADMKINLTNDGPVTIFIDSKERE
jgi:D-tyrosyl-tRNA(Tyr) deacylase